MIALNDQSDGLIELGGKTDSMYAVCSNEDFEEVKSVEIPNFASIRQGTTVRIKFIYSNTSSSPKLNINGLGQVPMYARTGMYLLGWEAGSVIQFTFDGQAWFVSGGSAGGSGMPSDPLGIDHGGTGNTAGYIRTGLREDETAGANATAEGYDTIASGSYSHAEGFESGAEGTASHAEGGGYAAGSYSHAEGGFMNEHYDGPTIAEGIASHAEGLVTLASGDGAHAEGHKTEASGDYSHAEGYSTKATNYQSHAEGYLTQATGNTSHAEGSRNIASGPQSHVGGRGNVAAYDQQTVIGRYNENKEGTLLEVGNGNEEQRSNALEVYQSGDIRIGGSIIDKNGVINSVEANPPGDASSSLSKIRIGDTNYTVSGGGGGLPTDPLTVDHGGTGNSVGYIQTGRKSGSAIGTHATAEGTNTIASGVDAHAEGTETIASGSSSHASGDNTVAGYSCQTVIGRYNKNKNFTLFEIGNGELDNRGNAFEVWRDGSVIVNGTIDNIDGRLEAIEANPSDPAPYSLGKIKIGGNVYSVSSGGGGTGGQAMFAGKSLTSGTSDTIDTNIDLERNPEVGDIILVDFSDKVYEAYKIIVYNNGNPLEYTIDSGLIIPGDFYIQLSAFRFNGDDFSCEFKNAGYEEFEITAGTGIDVSETGKISNTAPMKGLAIDYQAKTSEITDGALGSLKVKDDKGQYIDALFMTFTANATIGSSENYRYTFSTGSTMGMGNLYNSNDTYYTKDISAGSTLFLDISDRSKAIVVAVFGNSSGEPEPSVTYLDDVTGAASSIDGNSVTLTWTDPEDIEATRAANSGTATWAGTKVVRKEDVAPESIDDGVVVVDSTVRNQYSSTGYTDSNLSYNTTYYYRFFPYTTEGVVTVGTSLSVSLGQETIASLPEPSTALTYSGSSQTMTFVNYDSSKLNVSGNTGIDSGTYTASFTPRSGYQWWDGTTTSKGVSWSIAKKTVAVPTVSGSYNYDGNEHTANISNYSSSEITVSGTTHESDPGTYTVLFDLVSTPNMQWTDGTTTQKTGTWSIQTKTVTIPTVSGSYNYDGTQKSASITGLSDDVTYFGTEQSTNAGTFTLYFSLKDPNGTTWSDGTVSQKTGTWTINKASLSVPTVTGDYTYSGGTKYASISSYSTDLIVQTGTSYATNAGTYYVYFDLANSNNYQWVGGSTSQQSASWTINKASGYVILSGNEITFDPDNLTQTLTISDSTGTVSVTSASGSGATITGTVSGSIITFTITGSPTTTFTRAISVTVAESTNYTSGVTSVTAKCNFSPKTYGVSWDGTSTATLSRTDDAASFVDPSPAVGTSGTGSSPFDSILPWSGMTIETINSNVMVKIPKFYYRMTVSSGQFNLQISTQKKTGFSTSPAHMDRGDGKGERDYIYVAKYVTNGGYKSAPNTAIKYSTTRYAFRSNAPSGFHQWDYLTAWTVRMLYLVEFASWNFETKIGRCSTSKSTNTGATASMSYHTGTSASSKTAASGITQYRNIEMLSGGAFTFVDGVVARGSTSGVTLYIYTNPANFSDSYNGTGAISLGSNPTSSGYIKSYAVNSSATTSPLPRVASVDASNNYTTDMYEVSLTSSSKEYVVYTGGCITNGTYDSKYGLFYQNATMTSSDTSATVSSRLMYLP